LTSLLVNTFQSYKIYKEGVSPHLHSKRNMWCLCAWWTNHVKQKLKDFSAH